MPKTIGTKQIISLFVVLFAFLFLISGMTPGIGMPVYIAILLGLMFLNVNGNEKTVNRWAWLIAIPILALSVTFAISSSHLLRWLNWPVIFGLFILLSLALNNEWGVKTRLFDFIEVVAIRVFKPYIYFGKPFQWIAEKFNMKNHKGLKGGLIGVLIAIPLFLIILNTLSSIDVVFGESMKSVSEWIETYIQIPNAIWIIQGLIMAFYAVGLACAMASANGKRYLKVETMGKKPAFDPIAVIIVQSVIVALYALFTVIQFKYLFGGSPLPFKLSYADYARSGFFQLIGLSLFNFSFILIIAFFTRNTPKLKAIKTLSLLICGANMIMLASAAYRMYLYESAYGFTVLRLLVYAFLLFEAISLLFTAAYVLSEKVNVMFAYGAAGLAVYLALNFANLDNMIAKRNVDDFVTGQTSTIDVDYLTSLSNDAIPQLVRLAKSGKLTDDTVNLPYRENTNLNALLKDRRYDIQSEMSSQQKVEYNFSDANALKVLKDAGY